MQNYEYRRVNVGIILIPYANYHPPTRALSAALGLTTVVVIARLSAVLAISSAACGFSRWFRALAL